MRRRQPPDMATVVPIRTDALGAESLEAIEAISLRAFDPLYGEAWNKAQCLSVLALPGYRLRGAWIDASANNPLASLVGFSIDRSVADETELLLLAVDPAFRGKGVASQLLEDWLNNASDKGAERAFLEMREDNPARSLYERHGFSQIAVRKSYYRGNDGIMRDAVTMDCRLHVQ